MKSETTVIVKGESIYVNTAGNNGLAKGGSGDVLAGCITGLLAQNNDSLKAAALGVYLHACSADLLIQKYSAYGVMPSEVSDMIRVVIRGLCND